VNDDAPPAPSVTLSTTTANPGDVITATVANGPANPMDWVTFGLVTAPDPGYVAWKFLNGSSTPPAVGLTGATLQFTAPAAPGTYHVRFLADGGWTRLATSGAVTVQTGSVLTINDASVTEGNSGTTTATFTVTLTPVSTQTVTVAYTTAAGTAGAPSDYLIAAGTLTFAAGATTQTIPVTVNGDTTIEPDETFVVNLSSPTNATISDAQGVGTILNDDFAPLPALLSISNASVTEGNSGTTTAMFTVTLTPASTQTVTVAYGMADGTATAGSDYVLNSGTLTFAPGVSTQPISVTVNGDTAVELDETFVVNLSGATNATIGDAQGTGTIVNDDASSGPTVTASPTMVSPGDVITATVTNGPGNQLDWVTIGLATSPDPGWVAWKYLNNSTTPPPTGVTSTTVTFTAPATPGTYHLRFFANNIYQKLATSGNVIVQTTPTLTINSASVIEGNSSSTTATFTVTLSPTSTQTVTVAYATVNGTATAGSDYVAKTGTLTFAPGVSTQPISVTVNGDTTAEPTETFVVNLSGATNAVLGAAQGTGTIVNDDGAAGPTVTLSSTSVNPGDTITATLSGGPGNRLDWVTFGQVSATDSAYITWQYLNGSILPPGTGLTSATLQFTAPNAPGTYHIRWFADGGWTRIATSSTITVLGPPAPTLTLSSTTVIRGGVFTLTVTNGPGNAMDWVTLGLVTSADINYYTWAYLNGTMVVPAVGVTDATLQFTAPSTPGAYNLRFFLNGGWSKLATSATITVQ
jgi:Calx-beta domain-containing protein